MSQNPQERSKDSKKAAEDNIEQKIGNEDPTEPVEVTGKGEGNGSDSSVSGLYASFIDNIMLKCFCKEGTNAKR
jgi:hypothetical protein